MASGILGNKKMRPATTGLIRSGSFLLVLLCSWGAAEATNYTVGGSSRWALGVNYDTWASSQTFYVGDNLVFSWSGNHNVVNVSASEYSSCTWSSTLLTSSPVTIRLTSPGTTYYICAVSSHCSNGMKVSMQTLAASTAPAPATASAPSNSSSTSSPSAAPANSSSSSSSSSPSSPSSSSSSPSSSSKNTAASPNPSGSSSLRIGLLLFVSVVLLFIHL